MRLLIFGISGTNHIYKTFQFFDEYEDMDLLGICKMTTNFYTTYKEMISMLEIFCIIINLLLIMLERSDVFVSLNLCILFLFNLEHMPDKGKAFF